MPLSELKKSLRALADPAAAVHARRFFKTGPGEYGEGDQFLGIRRFGARYNFDYSLPRYSHSGTGKPLALRNDGL